MAGSLVVRTYRCVEADVAENALAVAHAFDAAGHVQASVFGPDPRWCAARLRERLNEEIAQAEARNRTLTRALARARAGGRAT
jgi:hypothetical protein